MKALSLHFYLVVVLTLHFVISLANILNIEKNELRITRNNTLNEHFVKLLKALQDEHNFHTLIFLHRHIEDCFIEQPLPVAYPRVLLRAYERVYLRSLYNREMLLVVCLNGYADMKLVDNMLVSLQHMRATRVLFLLRNFAGNYEKGINKLLRYCTMKKLLNVLAVNEDFNETGHFYSYKRFPHFKMAKLHKPSVHYPNQLQNLQQTVLTTLAVEREPEYFTYCTSDGTLQQAGYVYHLIATYAKKLNATLSITNNYLELNRETTEAEVIIKLLNMYDIDVPIYLTVPYDTKILLDFSHIVMITNWLPMIPTPTYIATREIYWRIVQSDTVVIQILLICCLVVLYYAVAQQIATAKSFNCMDIILNDKVFRGFLGQPFNLAKSSTFLLHFTYFLLFMQGLINSTAYSSFLNAMLNQPPTGKGISNFEDLKQTNTKIVLPLSEVRIMEHMSPNILSKWQNIFHITNTFHEFITLRKTLNTNYAYSVIAPTWDLVNKQQQFFARRLFQISSSIYFRQFVFLAIPLAENSIYRDTFNQHILEMHAYGFWSHWSSINFIEMIAARKMNIHDFSKSHMYRALKLEDLYYIWHLYLVLVAISVFGFALELLFKQCIKLSWRFKPFKKLIMRRN